MLSDLTDLQLGVWTLKFRLPPGDGPHPVIFLVHGWTGDENSMWVFAPRLPKNALLIAPRAPYISKHPEYAGYSWVGERGADFSSLPDFDPAVAVFDQLVKDLPSNFSANFDHFAIAGFSQGGAFSAAYMLAHREKISKLAMLSSFLPEGSQTANQAGLNGLPVFIAHGTQDETVPVARARQAKNILEAGGAQVRYCESEIGHKLGANCSTELAQFFST